MITIVIKEGMFAPYEVAEPAEHQCAERAHGKTGGESQQREDEGRGFIDAREELFADNARKRAIEIEVIPFKNSAERGGKDDFAFF